MPHFLPRYLLVRSASSALSSRSYTSTSPISPLRPRSRNRDDSWNRKSSSSRRPARFTHTTTAGRSGTTCAIDLARPLSQSFSGCPNWQSAGPGHVAIYIGNGQMVHAPQRGDVVRVGDVFDGMKARRVL